MIVEKQTRPTEGWHQSTSGTPYYVAHVGNSTHIECFAPGDVNDATRDQFARDSRAKARIAFPYLRGRSKIPRSVPMQRS